MESCTRAKDLCSLIANKLKLRSADGFSLFLKIADKGKLFYNIAYILYELFYSAVCFESIKIILISFQ